ncbi:hypothetical protein DFJ77DRAFT_441661 [Powellomyces hirtus]|nr:hypothetical protein DFJ77DRAFT_441661 [Powellomyces hirtus]
MESPSPAWQLELLLSTYLADDSTLHSSLPFVLRSVSAHGLLRRIADTIADFGDNPNAAKDSPGVRAVSALPKWSTRVATLLGATKQPQLQWAGCCLVRVSAALAPGAFQKDMRGWCNSSVPVALAPDVADAATELLIASKPFPALARDLNQMYLAKLVTVLCDRVAKSEASRVSLLQAPFLRNILTLLRAFPNGVRSQTEKIEILCLQAVANPSESPEAVDYATSCLLALVRADKEKASKAGESKVLNKVAASIDEVLDAMVSYDGGAVGLVLPTLESAYHAQLPIRLAQLEALCSCLCRIIEDTATGFAVDRVVDLVRRIYSITTRSILTDTRDQDALLLRLALPSACVNTNQLLCALLPRNLVHDCKFFSTICAKSLETSRSHATLRQSSYRLLPAAIDAFGSDFVKLALDYVSKEMVNDIQLNAPQAKKRKLQVADTTQDDAAPEDWALKLAALTALERLILLGQPHAAGLDLHVLIRTVLASLFASATIPTPSQTPSVVAPPPPVSGGRDPSRGPSYARPVLVANAGLAAGLRGCIAEHLCADSQLRNYQRDSVASVFTALKPDMPIKDIAHATATFAFTSLALQLSLALGDNVGPSLKSKSCNTCNLIMQSKLLKHHESCIDQSAQPNCHVQAHMRQGFKCPVSGCPSVK